MHPLPLRKKRCFSLELPFQGKTHWQEEESCEDFAVQRRCIPKLYPIPTLSRNLSISISTGHQSLPHFPSSALVGVLGEQQIIKIYLQINLNIIEKWPLFRKKLLKYF